MSIIEQLKRPGSGKEIKGQSIMDVERFAEDTRHMIVFDVLSWDCPVGDKGERIRIFLSDKGHEQALYSEKRGEMKNQIQGFQKQGSAKIGGGDYHC